MKQALDEVQQEVRDLAVATFGRYADPDRLTKLEVSRPVMDQDLWAELARSGLLGVTTSEAQGGLGFGLVEATLVCEAAGTVTALAPVAETLAAAWLIERLGSEQQQADWLPRLTAGEVVFGFAPPVSCVSATTSDDAGSPTGRLQAVPWATTADACIHVAGNKAWLTSLADAVDAESTGVTTCRLTAADVVLDGSGTEPIGDGNGDTSDLGLDAWRTLLAALQAGVTAAAVRTTARYTSSREQFGKPLSTFQAVALRAADAWIDARTIALTARQAAWLLDSGLDARPAALTAAWWAAEAGQRCVHATQHLHGGMGADITYPVHRNFLWGKQIELLLGGAPAVLAELGDLLASQ